MLHITIDDQNLHVEPGTTILGAAKMTGIDIPTLCHLKLDHLGVENRPAGCRICVVEVAGRKNLAPSCATMCTEGMVIYTSSIRVINARKRVLELILSDHPKDCLTCAKSGDCDLQRMAVRLGIREVYGAEYAATSDYKLDISQSIVRDANKCIMCRRCETVCNRVQSVGALGAVGRGFGTVVMPAFGEPLADSSCTYCGQCVAVCPTGALTQRDYTSDVVSMLANRGKTVVVQTAPAVRVALGEEFGMAPGTIVTGKMVAALRKLGFDYVFDTNFAADLTIMEESAELLGRLSAFLAGDQSVRLPILTSCCPAWIKFFETYYPDMLDVPSTARSPQQMFGAIAKSFYAKKLDIAPADLVVVSVMPCLAKKYECRRPEFTHDGVKDVDFVITTVELARLIKEAGINFADLADEQYDDPLGASSGAATLFGNTGGVMEAAVRTAYELHTGRHLPKLEFQELRHTKGADSVRIATLDFGGLALRVGIASGLSNARKLLDGVRSGELQLHAIEIMACPGGCVGGGGQPIMHGHQEVLAARQRALYADDQNAEIRKSHENPYIKALYSEFLGAPLSPLAHSLLHTHYSLKVHDSAAACGGTPCGGHTIAHDEVAFIRDTCAQFHNNPHELISILHNLQNHFGFLPPAVQRAVAITLGIPVPQVFGVVSFYGLFTMEPKGKHPISICTGTACYVRGAGDIMAEAERVLGIKVGQTTPDGNFSLTTLRCVGACGLAPVMMVGDQIHGRVSVSDVAGILGL